VKTRKPVYRHTAIYVGRALRGGKPVQVFIREDNEEELRQACVQEDR
jgi:hypothetical protein